jgi:hypothetical protein
LEGEFLTPRALRCFLAEADEKVGTQSLGYAHVSHVQTLETLIDLRDFDPRLKVRRSRAAQRPTTPSKPDKLFRAG